MRIVLFAGLFLGAVCCLAMSVVPTPKKGLNKMAVVMYCCQKCNEQKPLKCTGCQITAVLGCGSLNPIHVVCPGISTFKDGNLTCL